MQLHDRQICSYRTITPLHGELVYQHTVSLIQAPTQASQHEKKELRLRPQLPIRPPILSMETARP